MPTDIYHNARLAGELQERLEDTFRVMRERHLAKFESSQPADHAAREEAYLALRAISDLKAELRSQTDAPKVSAFNARGARATAS